MCDDRFYTKTEYNALTPANRVYLRLKRDKRKGNTVTNPAKRMKAVEGADFSRTLSVLASVVDHLAFHARQPRPIVVAEEVNNSNNSALQRIETRQRSQPN